MGNRALGLGLLLIGLMASALSGCVDSSVVTIANAKCTTGRAWGGGNDRSTLMHPGRGCIGCHKSKGPQFSIAGTVFQPEATSDEDDCLGLGGVTITITGADGQVFNVLSNEVGNFYLPKSAATLALPYKATVTYQGKSRNMLTPQTSGDCNSCHTSAGLDVGPSGRVITRPL